MSPGSSFKRDKKAKLDPSQVEGNNSCVINNVDFYRFKTPDIRMNAREEDQNNSQANEDQGEQVPTAGAPEEDPFRDPKPSTSNSTMRCEKVKKKSKKVKRTSTPKKRIAYPTVEGLRGRVLNKKRTIEKEELEAAKRRLDEGRLVSLSPDSSILEEAVSPAESPKRTCGTLCPNLSILEESGTPAESPKRTLSRVFVRTPRLIM